MRIRKNGKVIRLTEEDLRRITKKVIKEQPINNKYPKDVSGIDKGRILKNPKAIPYYKDVQDSFGLEVTGQEDDGKTKDAIKKIQKYAGVETTGVLDKNTTTKLREKLLKIKPYLRFAKLSGIIIPGVFENE